MIDKIKYKIVIIPLTKVVNNECLANYQLNFDNIHLAKRFLEDVITKEYLKQKCPKKK